MRKSILLAALFICFLTITEAQISKLDPTFGINGIVKTNLGTPFNYSNIGQQILIGKDGSMYLIFDGAGFTLITKKHTDGSSDLTYGNNGISVSVAIHNCHAAIQTDGKVVVGGYKINPNTSYLNPTDFALARFNTDGNLDNTFGGNGIVTTEFGQDDAINSIGIQIDGKIIVAGSSIESSYHNSGFIALARYNTDGNLDTNFGVNGIVKSDFGTLEYGFSMAIQNNGKIVVAGLVDFVPIVIRFNDDGALDSSFNGNAIQHVDFGTQSTYITSVSVQSDYKIIVGGSTGNGSGAGFVLERFNLDGNIDSTFGQDGLQTTNFDASSYISTVTIQNDGKILAVGYTSDGMHTNFAISRYRTNGEPDDTFNGDGKQITDFGSSDDYAGSVAIQGDGKLVAMGSTTDGINSYVALARYNDDGSPDNSFDGDGILVDHLNEGDTHYTTTAIQSDGKIVSAGYTWNGTNYDFAVVRYNQDGSLDNEFSDDGIKIIDFGHAEDKCRTMVIQTDGKILVAGSSGDNFGMARINTDGSLDNTFDEDGLVTTDFGIMDSASSIAIQSDGKLVVAGTVLTRYNADGSLDLTFNGNGIINIPFGNCNGVAIQNDGKIVVVGGNGSCSIARFNGNGVPDNTFGENGVKYIDLMDLRITGKSIALQQDGKIVIGGNFFYGSKGGSSASFALLRLNTDGNLDDSFDGDGMIASPPSEFAFGTSVLVQNDNKIILAGYSYNGLNDDFSIVRFNTDGTLDHAFGVDGVEITKTSTANNGIAAIALENDKLYAAGYGQYPGSFGVVAKYLLASEGPLPVTFLDFTAELKDKSVFLQWKTLSEHNLSHFIIEHSPDGNSFLPISSMVAIGNSNKKMNYSTIDNQPLNGTSFYRLKIFDTDGNFKYSKIVSVNINWLSGLKIFPNPLVDILFIQFGRENQKATFKIFDVAGRKLKEGKVNANGTNSFIPINTLSKGMYHLQVRTKAKTETRTFIKE
ncbi:MAG: T9SS type A sorting domain-containing protein [Ginsengibacter sp.]